MVLFVISTFRKYLKNIMMNAMISIPCACFGRVIHLLGKQHRKIAKGFGYRFSSTF